MLQTQTYIFDTFPASFLLEGKKTTPKSFPVVWGSPVRCPSASSSFSSPSSSGRPHQLYISKSLRTRPAWKLTVAASKYKEGVHRKSRDSAFKVKLERGMCPNSQIQRNNFQKKIFLEAVDKY